MTEPAADAFSPHNHTRCTAQALERAQAICLQRQHRLTKTRRRVLEILLESHRALRAYEILSRLNTEGYSNQPPIVYRALAFLQTVGFVHKIETLNAFIACISADRRHQPLFLVCAACANISELAESAAPKIVNALCEIKNFQIDRLIIEAHGRCPNCVHHRSENTPCA